MNLHNDVSDVMYISFMTYATSLILHDLCLTTIYFQNSEGFKSQKHSFAMGSLVSPMVANLVMKQVKGRVLITFTGTAPSHWFRYVNDTRVKIRAREVEAFTEHINGVDNNIKFTREDVRGDSLPFSDCTVHNEENRSLNIEMY